MKKEYDVIIVGAGPAGSMAARYSAVQGISVLMLEKDRDVGYPVRCGEAISKGGIEEFITIDQRWISTPINKFSFISPGGIEVVIPLEEQGYILERKIFDYALAESAAKEGAEIQTRAYVYDLIIENGKVSGVKVEIAGEKKEIKSKIVIGADGVESRVGRWAGLKTYTDFRDMESGTQVTASNINVDQNTCYFYFGKDVAPQGYLWVFPKGNNLANIGLGVSGIIGKKKSALSYLNDFMDSKFPNAPVLTRVAGGIPCTITLEKIVSDGLMLVGDAARQINPLSGGGIASGMIGGSIAGRVAGEAVKMNKLEHIYQYESDWHNRLGKRHKTFDNIKNGIFHFTDEKFNNIAKSVAKVEVDQRSIGNVFKVALFNNPSLMLDVAKAFFKK
ncbi:MAG: NAD(P)/FAD-dependent oxidoreductase [Ignavibacteriae bacterium]|nr:NAD(P)/FAD-dependent oxidoreductase [Ignavibacteriota bacterium]